MQDSSISKAAGCPAIEYGSAHLAFSQPSMARPAVTVCIFLLTDRRRLLYPLQATLCPNRSPLASPPLPYGLPPSARPFLSLSLLPKCHSWASTQGCPWTPFLFLPPPSSICYKEGPDQGPNILSWSPYQLMDASARIA